MNQFSFDLLPIWIATIRKGSLALTMLYYRPLLRVGKNTA